jgi:hypothetical protein
VYHSQFDGEPFGGFGFGSGGGINLADILEQMQRGGMAGGAGGDPFGGFGFGGGFSVRRQPCCLTARRAAALLLPTVQLLAALKVRVFLF